MNYLRIIILGIFVLVSNIYSQNPPSDFQLTCTVSGSVPWSVSETITILANGQAEFVKIKGDQLDGLVDTSFTISSQNVQQIWQTIQNNNFFSLNANYKDTIFQDGSIALFTITANGTTKQVMVKNTKPSEILNIINSINSNVPANFNLNYSPPEKINIVPIDPCGNSNINQQSLNNENLLRKYNYERKLNYSSNAPIKDEIQIPHGGVEIGYEYSLFDAVATGRASLKSKGEFFGDGVSITGDNTKNFPPEDNNTIKIKLNLEFYGPCDNAVNESKIKNDILNKWNGQKTSDGKIIEIEVNTLSHPGIESAPGTPGFDNILLDCGDGRSVCDEIGTPNNGSVGGTWYPEDKDNSAGLFGHEAGHLMGLKDQYDDWTKLPTGKWQNSNGGQPISDDEMKNLLKSRAPDLTPERIEFDLKKKSLSIPRENHENDLMARTKMPVLQSDIDALAAQAGLIIYINAGDILSNLSDNRQNLLVTHTGDLFVPVGEKKTLNGIYAACLDKEKAPPNQFVIFNVAPSLNKWNGIPAAHDLLKLVKYTDSLQFYCGNNLTPQYAIWRITDNYSTSSEDVNSLFEGAGINIINKIYSFPRLTNNAGFDTISRPVVPNELFYPDVQPKIIQAEIGESITFSANISKPSGFNYTTDFSWLLNAPNGSLSQINPGGTFIPDKEGVYSIGLQINITDSVNNNTEEYLPDLNVYGIVPGMLTETFEHANLQKFHWQTYGDSEWEITSTDAQTGTYSVKPNEISEDQSTTLAIIVNLPRDTSMAFAVKMLTNSGRLNFRVDSNLTGSWNEIFDWKFFEYELDKGEHRLTWEFLNYYDAPASVFLDNIFFPANSVVTSINSIEQIPLEFKLYQNYPNPFNPTTKIKYSIPSVSQSPLPGGARGGWMNVQLKIYDILGREVATLVNKQQSPGNYDVEFNASNLSSGVYFYKLTAGELVETRKMLLLK